MAEFFVVIAGQPKGADSEVVLSRALNARQAHEGAAAEYRSKRGLAPSVYVRTATAHRSDEEDDALIFMARLLARMDDEVARANGLDIAPPEPPHDGSTGEVTR